MADENCVVCGAEVRQMTRKGTGVCGELCAKKLKEKK